MTLIKILTKRQEQKLEAWKAYHTIIDLADKSRDEIVGSADKSRDEIVGSAEEAYQARIKEINEQVKEEV